MLLYTVYTSRKFTFRKTGVYKDQIAGQSVVEYPAEKTTCAQVQANSKSLLLGFRTQVQFQVFLGMIFYAQKSHPGLTYLS